MPFRFAALLVTLALLCGCAATVRKGPAGDAPPLIPQESSRKLVLNLGGSAASVNADDWDGFKLEWKVNFVEQARLAGVAFDTQDGPPTATGEDGTLLYVHVDNYRFLRPGTRYAFGVMAGNAYIKSKLTFSNLKTGEAFGSQGADTTSSALQGVFSPMTNKQVAAIAADVFAQLKGSKPVK